MSLLGRPSLRLLPVGLAVVAVLLSFGGRPAHADVCTGTSVYCENQKPGNPRSQWDVVGAGDPSIQGFATDISVNQSDTVQFKVKTNAQAYHLDIYRLGYYGGNGARLITTVTPSAQLPQTQPACLSNPTTGLVDCGNWAVSAQWNVPADAVSGIYIAKLVLLYALGGILVATLTSGLPLLHVSQWWNQPIVYEKAVLWTVLLELIGVAGSWGPLAGKIKPMKGGILFWARPGTIRLRPWKWVPLTGGERRTWFDVGLYIVLMISVAVGPQRMGAM